MQQHPGFFDRAGPFPLRHIAEQVGAALIDDSDGGRPIDDVRPLGTAGPSHLAFFDNRRYADQLRATDAGACIVSGDDARQVPSSAAVLTTPTPYAAFAKAMRLFYADALRSKAAADAAARSGLVHPTARIDAGAIIEPGAVIGREAVIGSGTTVAACAVVGYRVVLGRDCYVGPGASLTHAVVGDGVIIHAGARIGQDGFGFALGAGGGRLKVPQVGCVRIGDDVEIGANTTVDRGTLADTVIGTGTKIDNLVQIAHNVVIGKHCIIVAQSGIAGSTELGDYVVMGAKSGAIGHVKIGRGAQIAATAQVKEDVPPGAKMGGTPARPFAEWAREMAAVRMLARRRPAESRA